MLYHKIPSLYKRTEKGELLQGQWSDPVFEYLANCRWHLLEKIDGTNIRVIIGQASENVDPPTQVEFGGRTEKAQLPAPLVRHLQEKFHHSDVLRQLAEKFPDGAVLFGEGCGKGIQKAGKLYGEEQRFVLFDVNIGGWWLEWRNVVEIATSLDLPLVPEVDALRLHTLHEAESLVRRGFRSAFGDFEAEGVVATPEVPLFTRGGKRVITKLKTRDWNRVA